MTHLLTFLLIALLLAAALTACNVAPSTPAAPPAPLAPAQTFFPDAAMMEIGAYYYPEAWPRDQWARDMANMKKLNMEFVHMGEFAWAFMEPTEGHFDFSWLDENVKLAAAQGLKVVLCTPTPTPPVWLAEKHPEILMVDAAGRRMLHGTRQQADWSSPVYREYVAKIVNALGQHYGNNPNVWGWQLDNELSHYGKEPSFADASQISFRHWLQKKYVTIDALNRDWGNSFWSQMYQNFDQIRLPNQSEVVAQMNPHALLDSQRWFADEAADYLRFQTNILRKYCGNRQWITTNFMNHFAPVNPALNGKDFDIITWTVYPVHGNANEGPLGFRLGSAASFSYYHDFTRSINGTEGIMELQPGQVNWGEVNPQPYPGAVHMWLMRSFAAGAKIVCTYRYREPRAGAEMYHYGLVGPDGVTPTNGGLQYQQAAQEIALLRTLRPTNPVEPPEYAARRTAILYNVENRWDIDNHKQTTQWNTVEHALKYYRALKRLGCPVDVLTPDKDFSQYPVVIAPAYQLVDDAIIKRWTDYVTAGGHLVLTCRTGQKDTNGHLWEAPWAGPILHLIGAKIAFYDTLPAPNIGKVKLGIDKIMIGLGNTDDNAPTYDFSTWAEILDPQSGEGGSTPLATYVDQFYAGRTAAVTRTLGKGSVTYIGVETQTGGLEYQLIRGVFERAHIPAADLPENFLVDWRDGFWVATNYTEKQITIPAPANAKIIVGTRELGPAGVAVWQ